MLSNIKITISIVLLFTLFTSCFDKEKTDVELLEKDKKELKENLNSYKITLYKFTKIIIRSSAEKDTISTEYKSIKSDLDKIFNNVIKYDFENPKNLSLMDYISIYHDYKKMEDFIEKTDEDIFPTLTEVFSVTYGDSISNSIHFTGEQKEDTQNMEHAILSAIVVLSKDLGKEVALYECSKTKPEQLPDSELKTILQYFRGFLFFEKGLYYLSEDELTRNIDWLNNNRNVDLKYTRDMFKWGNLDNENTHIGFHSLNHLFRGYDRLMMDREIDEQRALEDFEMFLKDAKKIGLDNEVIWSIETYLYLKNEENDKAIASLTKLKSSNILSSYDKKRLDESIEYVNNRESGKVLNGIYDKYFLSKIASKYMLSILSQIDWEKILKEQNVPHTEEMFKTIDNLNGFVENLNKYASTEKLKDTGENLWNKAKGLIEE